MSPLPKSARDRLRLRALNLLDEYEALVILLNGMNRRERARIDVEREGVAARTRAELERANAMMEKQIADLRRDYGATLPGKRYVELLRDRHGRTLVAP